MVRPLSSNARAWSAAREIASTPRGWRVYGSSCIERISGSVPMEARPNAKHSAESA